MTSSPYAAVVKQTGYSRVAVTLHLQQRTITFLPAIRLLTTLPLNAKTFTPMVCRLSLSPFAHFLCNRSCVIVDTMVDQYRMFVGLGGCRPVRWKFLVPLVVQVVRRLVGRRRHIRSRRSGLSLRSVIWGRRDLIGGVLSWGDSPCEKSL